MKIDNIKTITETYISAKGNEFTIVSLDLSEIPENLEIIYKPRMYGTIDHKYLDENGRLKTVLNLISLCTDQTVADAIQRREDFEAIEGMTDDEMIEYFKAKKSASEAKS